MAGRERDEELARLIAQPFKLVGGGVPLRVYLLAEDGAGGRAVLLFSAHHAIRCASLKSRCWALLLKPACQAHPTSLQGGFALPSGWPWRCARPCGSLDSGASDLRRITIQRTH